MRRAAVVLVALIVVLLLVWIVGSRGSSDASNTAATTPTSVSPLTGVLATPSSSAISGAATGNSSTDGLSTDSLFPEAASIASAASASAAAASASGAGAVSPPDGTAAATTTQVATTVADPAAESAAAAQTAAEQAAAQSSAEQAAAQSSAQAAQAAQAAVDAAAAQAAADAAAAQAAADAARPRDPDGRLICPDSSVRLTATVGAPTYRVGQQPIVGVTVQNVGNEACVRDLSGGMQEYLAYDAAGTRIWSTNDCLPGTGVDIRLMNPGDSLQYNIKWSARTSQPGCAGERTTVGAGTYTLEVHIGTLISSQVQLTFT